MHLFEHWCYLDTVDSDEDLTDTVNTTYTLKFDLDIYRLIGKALIDLVILLNLININ